MMFKRLRDAVKVLFYGPSAILFDVPLKLKTGGIYAIKLSDEILYNPEKLQWAVKSLSTAAEAYGINFVVLHEGIELVCTKKFNLSHNN